MCGRFTLHADSSLLAQQFDLREEPVVEARYNVAPSQIVTAIRRLTDENHNETFAAKWGLVPFWAKDEKVGYRMINARIETAAQKPAFREALQKRRCIIPASGFYEWKQRGTARQPFYFFRAAETGAELGGPCLPLAAIWETWESHGNTLVTVSILTTAANDAVSRVHHRMPVILQKVHFEKWLSNEPLGSYSGFLSVLICPAPAVIALHPVTPRVNAASHEGWALIEPIALPPDPQQPELRF